MQQDQEFADDFLKDHFQSGDFRLIPLAGDASNRRYYRVVFQKQSWVLMRWDAFDPKNYPFLSVLQHFRKNSVHVPTVVAMSERQGLILLEDLGDLTLERKFWENQNPEMAMSYYKMAMDELIKIHFHCTRDKNSDCTAFKIQFDTERLLWEMNYGKDNLLKGVCALPLSEKVEAELVRSFTDICEKLHQEPKYIAHRDYHSRNLMIKYDEMRVIDFQDARLGPIQYDLVSLLKDSYVLIPDSMSLQLLDYYLDQAKEFVAKDFSKEHFQLIYELQSIQRCFKACGSFASFYHQRKDTRYLKYIAPTLKRVLKSLHQFPDYKVFSDILLDSSVLDRQYELLT